jgi:hypothetical protein
MHKQIAFVFAALALSVTAFAQVSLLQDHPYQIGYAANLNIGDSVVNISNDGTRAGFYNNNIAQAAGTGLGNICVNVFTFDPSEEEISCCACLVTPNALVSLSAKNDLINNVLTPAIPTSIVIKLVSTVPGTTGTAAAPVYNVCNPTLPFTAVIGGPGSNLIQDLEFGMTVWGTTLEPGSPAGTYGPVNVPFINPGGVPSAFVTSEEIPDLTTVCSFVRQEGTGFGQCGSCALGALSGTKQ